jgi:hypothetical protein
MNADLMRAEAAEAEAKKWQAIADDEAKSDDDRKEARFQVKKKTDWAVYYREQAKG